jgi:ribose-phosphate pyrophosphokinase
MVEYTCSIIADPNGGAWNFACGVHKYLAEKIKADYLRKRDIFGTKLEGHLKGLGMESAELDLHQGLGVSIYELMRQEDGARLEMNPLKIIEFPDGEYKPKIDLNVRRSNCFFIHDSNLNPDTWANRLRLVNNALRTSSPHEVINVLPYLKWSRQDRKDESRVPIGAKDVADSLRHDHTRVLTLDVHNDAIQGFYDIPFDSLPPYSTLFGYLEEHHPEDLENLVLLGADEGSVKRFRKEAEKRNFSFAMVDKFRESNGELGGSLGILGEVSGKTVLIPDDIIASGGTMVRASRVAKEKGATKVIVYGTHALCTNGYDELVSSADLVLVGDSIAQPYMLTPDFKLPENVEIISFVPLMGEAIYSINNGDSLSELFE